jgi:hypothetical protein
MSQNAISAASAQNSAQSADKFFNKKKVAKKQTILEIWKVFGTTNLVFNDCGRLASTWQTFC